MSRFRAKLNYTPALVCPCTQATERARVTTVRGSQLRAWHPGVPPQDARRLTACSRDDFKLKKKIETTMGMCAIVCREKVHHRGIAVVVGVAFSFECGGRCARVNATIRCEVRRKTLLRVALVDGAVFKFPLILPWDAL